MVIKRYLIIYVAKDDASTNLGFSLMFFKREPKVQNGGLHGTNGN